MARFAQILINAQILFQQLFPPFWLPLSFFLNIIFADKRLHLFPSCHFECLICKWFLFCCALFRLKTDNNGGAWCPKHMVSNALKDYLQVDLLQTHVITAIRTQGRYGKGQGQEYTEAYVLEYWRPGFTKWQRWKNTQGKEVSADYVTWWYTDFTGISFYVKGKTFLIKIMVV